MGLIAEQDFEKVFKGKIKPADKSLKLLMRLLKIDQLNQIYDSLSDKSDRHFFNAALDELGVLYDCSAQSIDNIPKKGPFIVVANHPYGGIDGMLMLKTISHVRSDFMLMGNFLLHKIKPLEPYVLPVNPFIEHPEYSNSLKGIRQALDHLKNGGCLGIFPAGEVSSLNIIKNEISDKKWSHSILKFIKNANVPVVPFHFSGSNSRVFHIMGLIHPELRTVKLPSELFNKKDKLISLRIGSPLSKKEQLGFNNIEQYGRFLRAMTYLPVKTTQIKEHFNKPLAIKKQVQAIAPPVETCILKAEIANLASNRLLFNHLTVSVYCAPYHDIPNIMNEIGRLREITFREVGEGTNRSNDLDEYDLYYWHLFLWDNAADKLMGAYRIGKGEDIYEQLSHKGFYTHSLFKFKKEFYPVLKQSLELGRSFVIKEYQKKPMPLYLLWKGIFCFIINNPEYRYLMGPVSISNDYSELSRGLMIKFIRKYYSDSPYTSTVKPRLKHKVKAAKSGYKILINAVNGDFNKLERIISDLEKNKVILPVLLKKYLQLNGRILAFNVDPLFNDSLDGFLLLDLFDVPHEFLLSLSKEFKGIDFNQSALFSRYKNIV